MPAFVLPLMQRLLSPLQCADAITRHYAAKIVENVLTLAGDFGAKLACQVPCARRRHVLLLFRVTTKAALLPYAGDSAVAARRLHVRSSGGDEGDVLCGIGTGATHASRCAMRAWLSLRLQLAAQVT
jgi:hypothetical protein